MYAAESELTTDGELVVATDPRCEWCERSITGRFRDALLASSCDSCDADFERELRADHFSIAAALDQPTEESK